MNQLESRPAERATTRLRGLLREGMVVAAGCYDPLSARLAELSGFPAVHLTGLGMEVTQLGAPDLGLLTLSEVASHAARITSAIDIPVLADADTGFGGVLNVHRTVRELERAGIAGIHIEDQPLPKRCPVLDARTIVTREQAVERVAAACAARTDPDFVIVARTDADTVSLAEVIERCNVYLEAGADMVMPMLMNVDGVPYDSLPPDEQMALHRRVVKAIDGPVMGMGNPPPEGYTVDDMAAAGYAFFMFTATALGAAANAISEAFAAIKQDGTDGRFIVARPGRYHNVRTLMEAVRLEDYFAIENGLKGQQ
ncbi:isocitrate lyase/PEP mutase family protein [Amycolatopsis jejuensis]|uniref:isocitrate lyase/PEP mutase family protein n=1 Tax=Amycolatopsis jejuensis TaxID=330084 RepID=UPI000692012C|nr:isocitrate lyase/PEP mutase family protein [Amycolatopsis jejuensis]